MQNHPSSITIDRKQKNIWYFGNRYCTQFHPVSVQIYDCHKSKTSPYLGTTTKHIYSI